MHAFSFFEIPFIPSHVAATWFAMALLLGVSFLATRRMSVTPGPIQNFMEVVVSGFYDLLISTMGKEGKKFFPLIATIGLFVLTANLMGLVPGFESPTANLNTNLAMALVVVVLTHIVGFKIHGIGYLKQFVGPVVWLAPLIIPIEIISHLSRLISLPVRLFGNIEGGHIVLAIIFMLAPFLVPLPILILKLLISLIQTLVFMLLSMMYIAGAMEEHH